MPTTSPLDATASATGTNSNQQTMTEPSNTTQPSSSNNTPTNPQPAQQASPDTNFGGEQIPGTDPVPQQEPKWLLMCSTPHKLPTTLSQLDATLFRTDKAFFRSINAAYLDLKSDWHAWLSLKGVVAIKFVRVSLNAS